MQIENIQYHYQCITVLEILPYGQNLHFFFHTYIEIDFVLQFF